MSERAIKTITKKEELEEVIDKCDVCYIGFVDNNNPYVLAFNFGYDGNKIYIHTSKKGKKLEIIEKNNNVCVFFDAFRELFSYNENVACSYRMRYKSVMAFGKIFTIDNYEEKIKALNLIMKKYTSRTFNFSQPAVDNINILCVKIESITGRKFEYL